MPANPTRPIDPASRRPIRWRAACILLLLMAAAVGAARFWPNLSHQERNLFTAQALLLGSLSLLVWLLCFSRARWRARLLAFCSFLLLLAGTLALVRIRGVSGDLLPILEWRFHAAAVQTPASPNPAAVGQTRVDAVPSDHVSAQDYPQFLGPNRNGTVGGPALSRDWSAKPPKLLWQHLVGPAWSGFAVAGGRAITLEQQGHLETVACYDLRSGVPVWTHRDQAHYQTIIAGEGPRTTPTIVGSNVFTMGATGRLNCLDLATGRVVWSRDVPAQQQGKVGEWGMSCSPLALSALIIVSTGADQGRSLAAYEASTGAPVWAGGEDRASYSSPVAATLGGTLQVISFNSRTVAGHESQTGKVLWKHPWPAGHPHITTPLILTNDRVLVSSGYGTGSEMLQVRRAADQNWSVQRLWKSNRLKSKFANLLEVNGYIYGLDDGIMVCLDAATGGLKWKETRYGHGQMILRGNLILVMAEDGAMALVEPNPDAHRELTRFQALTGKTWNPPALAGPYLLVRNDREAACYDMPLAP